MAVQLGAWNPKHGRKCSRATAIVRRTQDLSAPRLVLREPLDALDVRQVMLAQRGPAGFTTLPDPFDRAVDGVDRDVDFTFVMSGTSFESVWRERRTFVIDGVSVPVARLLHIVKSKEAASP